MIWASKFLLDLKVYVRTSKNTCNPKIEYYLAMWSFTNYISPGVFESTGFNDSFLVLHSLYRMETFKNSEFVNAMQSSPLKYSYKLMNPDVTVMPSALYQAQIVHISV